MATSVAIWLGVTLRLCRVESGPKFRRTLSPPAIATVPARATSRPSLRTCGASSAM